MKRAVANKSIIRLCEGSYELIKQDRIKGEYYLKNRDGFLAVVISSKGVKEKQCKNIDECIEFFK